MSKPKFNLYNIINNFQDDYSQLYEFIINYGELALHNTLKIGKCNFPLVEAIQKNKQGAFDIILKALPLEIIMNDETYLYNIVYSIKQHKTQYYYRELLNKIEKEDPNNQIYYSKILIQLGDNWNSNVIQPIIFEFFNYPLFNVQQFFNNWKFQRTFLRRIYIISKPKLQSLIKLFENHGISHNSLLALIFGKWFGYFNGIQKTLYMTKERQDTIKIFTKIANLIDLDKKENWTQIINGSYTFIDYNSNFSFRLFLLFSAFPQLIRHYDSNFNPELIEELILLCEDNNLSWAKHFSIFSPINDLIFLINNFNPEITVNLEKVNETLGKYKELLKYLSEIKDLIYNKENPKFKDFILEILSKIKEIINGVFLLVENNSTLFSKKDLFTNYLEELIEKTNEIFN